MKSQREIERRYNSLLKEIETSDFYKVNLENRVNCYVCKCGHITKTKDVDSGVTPFIHECEKCGENARSTFYQDIVPNKEHTGEWFRPSLKQVLKMRKNESMLEHILQGGLYFRKI
jgi:hypothetical protein